MNHAKLIKKDSGPVQQEQEVCSTKKDPGNIRVVTRKLKEWVHQHQEKSPRNARQQFAKLFS